MDLIIPKEYAWRALEHVLEYGYCLIVHDGEGLACFKAGHEPKDGKFVLGMVMLAPTFSKQLNSLAEFMQEGMAIQVSLFDADGPYPVVQFALGEWVWDDDDDDEEGGPFTCRLCGEIEDTLDGYDGMCGACADKECADAEEQEQQEDFKTQDEVWAELHLRDWIASLDEKEDNTDA